MVLTSGEAGEVETKNKLIGGGMFFFVGNGYYHEMAE